MNLADQILRERFTRETGKNFSVIAPAGVGKTRAIADRVLQLAQEDVLRFAAQQPARLPQLVVVTFTRKAADELRDRARRAIVDAKLEPRVLGWFNQAFFGTIHSFCLELLRRFGPLAGLPTAFTVERDDTALRLAFQRSISDAGAFLPPAARPAWRRFGSSQAVWDLVWKCPANYSAPPPGQCPQPDVGGLLAFQPARADKRSQKNIARSLAQAERWRNAPESERGLGLPTLFTENADFKNAWVATFHSLRAWLAAAAAHAACGLAAQYREFKQQQGRLGYDDFVQLALRLVHDPVIGERIRREQFSVLLDEAQDTDPAQFAVLAGVAQSAGAPGLWLEGRGHPPGPGRFSMVGDPQQAIFERADVRAYVGLHEKLLSAGAAEELKFSVTMRCDELIVEGVNAIFPGVLHGRGGQAKFVPLQARPGAGPGSIRRLEIARPADWPQKASVADRVRAEAKAVARWLAAAGPQGLGIGDWSELAVLAPRRDWLQTFSAALGENGLAGQMHSEDPRARVEPARAWLAALLGFLADPKNGFERLGLLREIFGISDDEIYRALRENNPGPNFTAATALLAALAEEIREQPLHAAVGRAVQNTQLRERLAAIGAKAEELDNLLDQAALAESRGETPADFARHLREGPAEAAEPAARPGQIQLLTNHKAKGLEWRAVVWFGLFVEPKLPHPRYPCWLPMAAGGEAACVYDDLHAEALDADSAWRAGVAAENCARFERLLYVSATRPKNILLAADASALGEPRNSLADILGILPGGRAQAWWEKLPKFENAPGRAEKPAEEKPPANDAGRPEQPRSAFSLPAAKQVAGNFRRRIRPSTLARHAPEHTEPDLAVPPEFPEEQPLPAAAVDYGNWWHGTMEKTPWTADKRAWQNHWALRCGLAADPVRAQEEIARFAASPLARRLGAGSWKFATELPFLWRTPSEGEAYDGCMDLVAWDAAANRWLVIDWKTDRVDPAGLATLVERYRPQLKVYQRALEAVYSAPVEAVIYSTRLGESAAI